MGGFIDPPPLRPSQAHQAFHVVWADTIPSGCIGGCIATCSPIESGKDRSLGRGLRPGETLGEEDGKGRSFRLPPGEAVGDPPLLFGESGDPMSFRSSASSWSTMLDPGDMRQDRTEVGHMSSPGHAIQHRPKSTPDTKKR